MIKTNKFSAILLIAGNSTRFNQSINKSLYELNKKPLFLYSLEKFKLIDLNKIYLVVKEEEREYVEEIIGNFYPNVEIVIGGSTRANSVKNALKYIQTEYVLIHDGARPLTEISDIQELMDKTIQGNYIASSLYHDVTDTIKEDINQKISHLNRNNLKAVTTPQCLKKASITLLGNPTGLCCFAICVIYLYFTTSNTFSCNEYFQ